MKYLVTGCAGFIGSNLVDRLLILGHEVIGIDNFSTGRRQFLENSLGNNRFTLLEMDLLDLPKNVEAFDGIDRVFHLAANADVRHGTENPRKDLEQNTIVTFNVLEAMRKNSVSEIVFSSTGSVYGESNIFPTPENGPFPVQTSLYAASKVACEGLISAYCEGYNFKSWIFRFVSILGERYTHGHVYDFYRKLKEDPSRLHVLGDGKQRKSYLYVQDCIDAILVATKKTNHKVNLFNLGVDNYCEVNDSISWICEKLNLNPKLEYEGGKRGWIGDNPFIFLDTKEINSLGWTPKVSIRQGVEKTLDFLEKNEWVFEEET